MRDRITNAHLKQAVRVINNHLGLPLNPYGKDADGRFKQEPDVFLLDFAYGGVALNRNMPDKGKGSHGVRSVLGRGSKRELYDRLQAFIAGMEVREDE